MRTPLQSRVFLITLLPVLLSVVSSGLFFLNSQKTEIYKAAITEHELRTEHIRLQIMANGNQSEAIDFILNDAMNYDDLNSISLYDARGNLLQHRGHADALSPEAVRQLAMLPEHQQVANADIWLLRIAQPAATAVVHSASNTVITPPAPAWLEMDFSMMGLRLQRYQEYFTVLMFSLLLSGLSLIWVMWQTQNLLRPLRHIQEMASRLRGGHFDIRFSGSNTIELNDLSVSLNQMLELVQNEVEDLKQTMNQTHEDLQSTLESMEIQNIELSLARKEALEGTRIKSEFLANISHEIRTPLNSILGFIQLLARSPLPPRQMDYVLTIQKSSNNLLAMLNDVLDLSKIEARKLVLDIISLNLEECVYDVMTMLAPLADAKSLNLITMIYEDVPLYWKGDPLRLKQILTNLVNNAIKFTEKGDITLRVMLESNEQSEAILRFTVQDTGIGLDQKIKNDLFRAFAQADASTSRHYGGTGLGLVISKYLVEQMGGEIGFESKTGEGALFWFTVHFAEDTACTPQQYHPLYNQIAIISAHAGLAQMWKNQLHFWAKKIMVCNTLEDAEKHSPPVDLICLHLSADYPAYSECPLALQQIKIPTVIMQNSTDHRADLWEQKNPSLHVLAIPLAPSTFARHLQEIHRLQIGPAPLMTSPPTRFSKKILVVDDQPANLKLVATLLEDLGLHPLTANSGASALELVADAEIQLVFMDIQMPGMDGMEASRKIRSLYPHRPLVLIALTAHVMDDEREQFLLAGMNDVMTKPFQEAHLISMLQRWYDLSDNVKKTTSVSVVTAPDQALLPLVDLEDGMRLTNGRLELATSMIDMLMQHIPKDIEIIKVALDNRSIEALLDRIHYVHSASHYCGVPRLRHQGGQLESNLKQFGKDPLLRWTDISSQTLKFLDTLQELLNWHRQQNTTLEVHESLT